MRLRWSRWLVVLALTLSLGAHWALLQSLAWVGMVAAYSHDGSISEALSETFDGKHPCCLCKLIQQGRAEEKKQDQQQTKPISKMDVGLIWQSAAFNFDCDREGIPSPDLNAPSRCEEPPKPRPRCSLAGIPA
jgi:hypothetical protein